MQILPSIPRPSGLRTVMLKHSMTDAQDCELSWKADFGKMEILLYVSMISPVLLLDFLAMLPKRDERFQQTRIMDVTQISARFKIKLVIQCNGKDVCYNVRCFKIQGGDHHNYRHGVELL